MSKTGTHLFPITPAHSADNQGDRETLCCFHPHDSKGHCDSAATILTRREKGKIFEILLVKTPVSCQKPVSLYSGMGSDQKIGEDTISFPSRFPVCFPDGSGRKYDFRINDHCRNPSFTKDIIHEFSGLPSGGLLSWL